MIRVVFAILLIIPGLSHAQKQGNIWYFGDRAGLDFASSPPTPLLYGKTDFPLPNQWNEGSSSICDSSGSLLFYSDGMRVWNRQHSVMPDGDNLLGHASSSQSCIIVPKPLSDRYFYLFTTDALENDFINGLRYSVVDICEDNGFGNIVVGTKNTRLLDTASERLLAIQHQNKIDYWVITQKFGSNQFCAFRLADTGIVDTVVSSTGMVDEVGWGQITASRNGSLIAVAAPGLSKGYTQIIDFDPSTGILSNARTLSSSGREYGVAISPDNSKIYFSTTGQGEVFQYNLGAGTLSDIINSKSNMVQGGADNWRMMCLGPDGIIYIARPQKGFLSAINDPDSLYPSCNYVDTAQQLGGQLASHGLPNFVAGFTYNNTAKDCVNGMEDDDEDHYITAFPNPAIGSITIKYRLPERFKKGEIVFFDQMGKEIERFMVDGVNDKLSISTEHWNAGAYYYQLLTSDDMGYGKKIIVVR